MANPTAEEHVDTHDPAGMAAWLRDRARVNREFAANPPSPHVLERWQRNVMPHLAFRFEQAADMMEDMSARLAKIAAYDPGHFRGLQDEIAIWKLATGEHARHEDTCPSLKSIDPGACSCGADDVPAKAHVCVFSRTGGQMETRCVLCGAPTRSREHE